MFQFHALDGGQFAPLFSRDEQDLKNNHICKVVADAPLGYPCRVTLCDASPGETLVLVNYQHLNAASPYQSAHAIYVSERGALAEVASAIEPDVVPKIVLHRKITLRAFDKEHLMIDAHLCDGVDCPQIINEMLSDSKCTYIHVHTALRGCYLARVTRR